MHIIGVGCMRCHNRISKMAKVTADRNTKNWRENKIGEDGLTYSERIAGNLGEYIKPNKSNDNEDISVEKKLLARLAYDFREYGKLKAKEENLEKKIKEEAAAEERSLATEEAKNVIDAKVAEKHLRYIKYRVRRAQRYQKAIEYEKIRKAEEAAKTYVKAVERTRKIAEEDHLSYIKSRVKEAKKWQREKVAEKEKKVKQEARDRRKLFKRLDRDFKYLKRIKAEEDKKDKKAARDAKRKDRTYNIAVARTHRIAEKEHLRYIKSRVK